MLPPFYFFIFWLFWLDLLCLESDLDVVYKSKVLVREGVREREREWRS